MLPSRNGHSRTAFFPSTFSLTRLAVTLLLLTPYQKKRLHSLIQKIVVQNIYQCTYKKLNHVVAYLRAVARTWVAAGLSGGRGGGGTAFEVNPPPETAMVLVVVVVVVE